MITGPSTYVVPSLVGDEGWAQVRFQYFHGIGGWSDLTLRLRRRRRRFCRPRRTGAARGGDDIGILPEYPIERTVDPKRRGTILPGGTRLGRPRPWPLLIPPSERRRVENRILGRSRRRDRRRKRSPVVRPRLVGRRRRRIRRRDGGLDPPVRRDGPMYRFNREMRVRIILLLIYRPLFFAAGLYTPLGTGGGT